MILDDIVRMAREAGIIEEFHGVFPSMERFAALVAAAEREACAKVVERNDNPETRLAAAAIRARGETK